MAGAVVAILAVFLFFKQKTAYEMRISDWSSDVCSSDLPAPWAGAAAGGRRRCQTEPIGFHRPPLIAGQDCPRSGRYLCECVLPARIHRGSRFPDRKSVV